jgi:uncharacterized membrane protein
MSGKKRQQRNRPTTPTPTRPRPSDSGSGSGSSVPVIATPRLRIIQALVLIAFGVSCYLAFLSLTGSQAVGCGPESGCGKVLTSRWAYWFGIPVSLLALIVDAAFLFGTFQLRPALAISNRPTPTAAGSPSNDFRAWALIVPCAVMIAGAAAWFIIVQLVVLQSICPYCMVAHGAGLIAALLALASSPLRRRTQPAGKSAPVFRVGPAAALAGLGVAALIAGQCLHAPKTFVVQKIPGAPAAAPSVPPVASVPPGIPTTPTTAAQRLFPVYGGAFTLDVADLPVMGDPTNSQVMVALHDFTCHHCRSMHPILQAAQRAFGSQLVIVTLPMPFDPSCNPLMQRHNPVHTNACEYAMLSLAVWRADRSKHASYDDYLFGSKEVPPLRLAAQSAGQLVGADALANALRDPWVSEHVRLGISLYAAAYRQRGQGQMPQFIVGGNLLSGDISLADLTNLISQNLGIHPLPPTNSPALPVAPANP